MSYNKDTLFQLVFTTIKGYTGLTTTKVSPAFAADASFPQIVISPILTPKTSEGFFTNSIYEHTVTIIIDVFATSTKQLDDIGDKVDDAIGSIDWGDYKLRLIDSFQDYTNATLDLGVSEVKKNLHALTITYTLRGFGSW